MRPLSLRPWRRLMPGLALIALLVGLAACAPFGAAPPPPRSAQATATAAAAATSQVGGSAGGSPVADLPPQHVDPGWIAVVQVADSSKLGGPTVSSGLASAGVTASSTMTLGAFTLSRSATVKAQFACVSPAGVRASVQIAVDGGADTIQCAPTGAAGSFQLGAPASDVGRSLTVTATITTDGATPRWTAMVEQPK